MTRPKFVRYVMARFPATLCAYSPMLGADDPGTFVPEGPNPATTSNFVAYVMHEFAWTSHHFHPTPPKAVAVLCNKRRTMMELLIEKLC